MTPQNQPDQPDRDQPDPDVDPGHPMLRQTVVPTPPSPDVSDQAESEPGIVRKPANAADEAKQDELPDSYAQVAPSGDPADEPQIDLSSNSRPGQHEG